MSPPARPSSAFALALARLGRRAVTVVDVGARWGAEQAWFRLDPLARLIGFEPDATECARLNAAFDPTACRFVPSALGRRTGPATLHLTREPACASLFPPNEWMRERFPLLRPFIEPVGTATVPLTTLDHWAESEGVQRVDFIKLDTQGAELDILTGSERLLAGCLGIEAEVMFSPMYDGQPLFAEVDAFLRGRGFRLWRLDSLAHYSERPSGRLAGDQRFGMAAYDSHPVWHPVGDGRLSWANAIYFRDRDDVGGDVRSLLVLAALLEAAGDLPGSENCLVAAGRADPAIVFTPSAVPTDPPNSPPPGDPATHLAPFDIIPSLKARTLMTLRCRDCDPVPKVPGAGGTFTAADGTRYQLMHNGVRVIEDGYCGQWMTELIRLARGHHEPQEEWAFHQLLRHAAAGGTMLELGSNWGYYSLWFAATVPNARLLLVEPDPVNIETGRRNFALNRVAGEFERASVGRVSAPPQPFYCETDPNPQLVPQVCVDDLLDRYAVPRLEVLFADIQGAELEMLHGAARAIASGRVRFAVVSTHHHAISGSPLTHQHCLEFIRQHGGHVLVEHGVAESFSGDGLIVASFDPADRHLPPIHVSRNHPSGSLFPELNHELAAAWAAVDDIGRTFAGAATADPTLAAAWNRLRAAHPLLATRWPPMPG